LGPLFYIEIMGLIRSDGQVAVSNPKEGRHLRGLIGGQYSNSGSPERRRPWGDGGLVVARKNRRQSLPSILAKGSRGISTKVSLPAGFEKLGNLRILNTKDTSIINTKVLDLLGDTDVIIAAYTKLKSPTSITGNMTSGMDSKPRYMVVDTLLEGLQREIRTNTYKFKPAPRKDIPNTNGKGTGS
jgi:hypothetical protein